MKIGMDRIKMNRSWIMFFLVSLAGSMGSQSFANPTDSTSLMEEIPSEVLEASVLPLLNVNDLMNVSLTCLNIEALSKPSLNKQLARKKIAQLIGNLKKIEKGSAVIGPNPGEPDPSGHNEAPEYAEITEDYWVEERVVDTQGQYFLTMGEESYKAVMSAAVPSVPASWKNSYKPMLGLTDSQQRVFYAKRNEHLRELWPIAYTAEEARALNLPEHAPQAHLPKKKEFMYAGTEPLSDAIVAAESDRYSKENGKYYTTMPNGRRVEVRARALTYSGTNDPIHAHEYVDRGRFYREGPLPVGKVKNGDGMFADAKPNPRGLKGLVGGIWKAIDEPYDTAHSNDYRLLLGGTFCEGPELARLASRAYLNASSYPAWLFGVARWAVYR